jgi:hypothetical protein
MEPFLRNDQFNFIKAQTQILINGHSTTNDKDVLRALKEISKEKVLNLFLYMSDEQKYMIDPIHDIKDKSDEEAFLLQLKPYVIPFKEVTEQTLKKIFPKAKKLKLPSMENIDLKDISYLSWDDKGSNKKYIITEQKNKLIGIQGTFTPLNLKGICVLCNRFEEVGMFLTEIKGSVQGTYIKRGNHICHDSQKCNQNIITLDKLNDFIVRLKS